MPRLHPLRPDWRPILVLNALSTLFLTGFASAPKLPDPEPPTLAAGGVHACAVREGGSVWCWGNNEYGQLGDGTSVNRLDPVRVEGLPPGITAVMAGSFHTCALEAPSTIWCWGRNANGQLGDGTGTDRYKPVRVREFGRKIQAIAAGVYHTCALESEGDLWCWGDNFRRRLGDGANDGTEWLPVRVVNSLRDIHSLGAGQMHSCALDRKGELWCWGAGSLGALGAGIDSTKVRPVRVKGIPGSLRVISTGSTHNCALDSGGDIWCWGDNSQGQLGDGMPSMRPRKLTEIPASSMTAVASGHYHSCALDSQQNAWCWGENLRSQTGRPHSTWELPGQVSGLPGGAQALVAGFDFSCTLHTDGAVWCWGGGRPTPMQVRLPPPQVSSPNIAAPGIEEPELPGPTPTLPPKDDSEMYDDEF